MTIKDVAKVSGVSVSTVSRVLNNKPDVRDEVRRKVLAAVERLNYVPNNSARSLVQSRSDNIGVVVRGVSNPFYAEVLKAVELQIDKAGYTMVIQQIGTDSDEVMHGAVMEREKKLRGLLFLGGRSDYTKKQLKVLSVPFVSCAYSNDFGNLPHEEYSSVSIADEKTAFEAVSMLIKMGHRKIAALIASKDDRSISELRYMGYIRALKENGIAPDKSLIVCCGSFEMGDSYEAARRLAASKAEFGAIFAISDVMAIAAIKALDESGRSVPADCSVVAIDGLELSKFTLPTLTTFCQPAEHMGALSVEILLDLVEGRGGNRRELISAELRPGGSVCSIL